VGEIKFNEKCFISSGIGNKIETTYFILSKDISIPEYEVEFIIMYILYDFNENEFDYLIKKKFNIIIIKDNKMV
jgi:hypothetical protein